MKCESCNTRAVEVEEYSDKGQAPFRLCSPCRDRLLNVALRPLEFFNLAAIHGHGYYLHDDFYDYDTGEATQPHAEVADADQFPFPKFDQIKNDLNQLIDFSFVQYFTDEFVIKALQQFDPLKVLERLQEKVAYNRAINYKAYEMAEKVVGKAAGAWIKQEWSNRREGELGIFAEAMVNCLNFGEAFEILTNELEQKDDRFLTENFLTLRYFKNSQTLDWIEKVCNRISNVSFNWGELAASSQFSWQRAEKWLAMGRTLSLIALDALIYCTVNGERLNESLWMRELNPRLIDNPQPEVVAKRLHEYLLTDSVPRTKNAVNHIIHNLFEV